MGTFTLSIDTGNASFEDDASPQLARILRTLAAKLDGGSAAFEPYGLHEHMSAGGPLPDINGNTVGTWSYEGSGGQR